METMVNNTVAANEELKTYQFVLADGCICSVTAHSREEAAHIMRESLRS